MRQYVHHVASAGLYVIHPQVDKRSINLSPAVTSILTHSRNNSLQPQLMLAYPARGPAVKQEGIAGVGSLKFNYPLLICCW